MRNLMAVLMLAAGLTAMPVDAGYVQGNELDQYCASSDAFAEGTCVGFIVAVVAMFDQNYRQDNNGAYCTPKGVKILQHKKIVVKYLNDNPRLHHYDANYLVVNALIEAYDCDDGLSYVM